MGESLSFPTVLGTNLRINPYTIAYAGFYCGKTACTLLDLTGPSTICDSVNTYDFRILKNADCHAPTNWVLDTGRNQIKIVSVNDTLLRIKSIGNGSFKIKSKIFASCDWIQDSMMVTVGISSPVLNLGSDNTICPGNTILLNAKAGFSSYRWQDGSTDSTFLVRQPGTYHVEVSNACSGAIFRDTIVIAAHPPIPLDLGVDKSKCNNDTLHFTAPNDFLNYSWYPNYNINSTTSANVIVNPQVDTTYYLKAEKIPGCFAFDTIAVKVNHSTPIFLGADVSFCQGDSASFDAGAGFTNYQWNTGANSQVLKAKLAGTYSVIATTAEGCKSYDTVVIASVFPNPRINLSKDSLLCTGTSKLLDAGAGYTSYLWNDGTSNRTKSVNSPGTYIVTVTDRNSCVGMDSMRISRMLPLPTGFLPGDAEICSYGKLEIVPLNTYQNYLWSNNAITKTITINKPGLYWLQVKDANNCEGKDTMLITQKDCLSGFYVPNAFTPKSNGHNDDFKPLLFGDVKKFEFSVYNRWGQMVFHTTELYKGWNGQLAGKDADPGTYVWMCVYQLEGQERKMERGTVLLIR